MCLKIYDNFSLQTPATTVNFYNNKKYQSAQYGSSNPDLKLPEHQCCGYGMISSRIRLNFIPDPGSHYIRKKGKFLKMLPKLF
jgi:hypothetical protein